MRAAFLSLRILAVCGLLLAAPHCARRPQTSGAPLYCVTIAPLGAFLEPIVAGRAEVHVLVPPGASPHTYEITPADARAAATARALIYVDESLDAWAARLDAPTTLRLVNGIPHDRLRHFEESAAHDGHEHDHGALDPHVWLDPNLMRDSINFIVSELSKLDPEGAEMYQKNGASFSADLARLDEELTAALAPLKDRSVIQFHPALYYFLDRYSIRTAGVIQHIAGQEPSPREIKALADLIAAEQVAVIVTEPQLPDAPVRALSEATGARIAELDPLGGVPGRTTYPELLRHNAAALIEAFE